jgi:hypothetical protein
MNWGRGKGKFSDPCCCFVGWSGRLFYESRIESASSAIRAFRSGGSFHHVSLDILTRHVSAQRPLLPPRLGLSFPLFPSHAWPTPLVFSSMTPPPSSPTPLLPIHSQYPTSSRAGTHASPSPPARHSPVSWETEVVFMLHPRMVLHSPFSGGVSHHAFFFFNFSPSSSQSLQETAFNYPVPPKGPSHTTLSSTVVQIPPSRLLHPVEPCWRSMTAFSLVTTTCRSPSITPPTQHPH